MIWLYYTDFYSYAYRCIGGMPDQFWVEIRGLHQRLDGQTAIVKYVWRQAEPPILVSTMYKTNLLYLVLGSFQMVALSLLILVV